jgi:hypothetical protein
MSSRRRIRHAPQLRRYSRRDIVLAAAAVTAAVVGTALAIWMLRPGGVADRQPRATWLVALALVAAAFVIWWGLRPRAKQRERRWLWIAGGVGLVAVGAVLAGIAWPGGLLRQYETFTVPDTVPLDETTTTLGGATTTTVAGATTTTASPSPSPTAASTTVP